METYYFQGLVIPERAQLSYGFSMEFEHVGSGHSATVAVSILLNQVSVWIDTEQEWDIYDLRNTVKNIIQTQLSLVGYLRGLSYDIEITRVINRPRNIDFVFGIDIPCIAERYQEIDFEAKLIELQQKVVGQKGIALHRCFNDLSSAMKNAEDTAFYCYRAIESLRHHCAVLNGLSNSSDSQQWDKFREISGCEKSKIMNIKAAADDPRHGKISSLTGEDRKNIFVTTWDIVDAYLRNV